MHRLNEREAPALLAFVCLSLLALAVSQPAVQVLDSGNEDVVQFATAIRFYIDFINNDDTPHEITVTPTGCCLLIEEDDVDCEILELRPARVLYLGSKDEEEWGNNTGTAQFLFRNLYARFREGNCSFTISSGEEKTAEWTHNFTFSTYPNSNETIANCPGIDKDPDRGCSPVDCAIKYKGRRNFYRNSIEKCEPAVECNTRGKDGVTVIGYYDWEENTCHRYDWLEENSFSHIESDTEIPVDVDPSQADQYFPGFEPQLLLKEPLTVQLNCNRGYKNGIYCVCDKGWVSSGIHRDNPLEYHWCDVSRADPTTLKFGPRHLSKAQEISAIVALTLGNSIMFTVWLYLVYRIFCRKRCIALKFRLQSRFKWKRKESLIQED